MARPAVPADRAAAGRQCRRPGLPRGSANACPRRRGQAFFVAFLEGGGRAERRRTAQEQEPPSCVGRQCRRPGLPRGSANACPRRRGQAFFVAFLEGRDRVERRRTAQEQEPPGCAGRQCRRPGLPRGERERLSQEKGTGVLRCIFGRKG